MRVTRQFLDGRGLHSSFSGFFFISVSLVAVCSHHFDFLQVLPAYHACSLEPRSQAPKLSQCTDSRILFLSLAYSTCLLFYVCPFFVSKWNQNGMLACIYPSYQLDALLEYCFLDVSAQLHLFILCA